MVQGIEVDLFRPDDELQKLAKLAVELGVADALATRHRRRGARGRGRAPRRGGVGRRLGGGQGPVVQLLLGQRLLQRRQGLARPPRDPARLHARLHRASVQAGEDIDRPTEADRRRARPDHRRVPRAAARRRGARGVRREARALADRVPLRREPQLLHRALGAVGLLAQDPRARPGARRARASGPTPTTSSTCAATSSARCSTTTATAGRSAPSRSGPYYWPREIDARRRHHRRARDARRPRRR